MTPDYLILCFLSSLGVLQIAAAHSRLRGLLFFQSPFRSTALGLALVACGFTWFFAPGPRLLPDTAGGLNGNQQALLFSVSAGTAIFSTMLGSSLVNHRRFTARVGAGGLEALRETTYLHAIQSKLKELWNYLRKWIRRYYSGSTAG